MIEINELFPPKRTYFLFGGEAISALNEGREEFKKAFDEGRIYLGDPSLYCSGFDLFTWEGDSKQVLELLNSCMSGWEIISEDDFNFITEL